MFKSPWNRRASFTLLPSVRGYLHFSRIDKSGQMLITPFPLSFSRGPQLHCMPGSDFPSLRPHHVLLGPMAVSEGRAVCSVVLGESAHCVSRTLTPGSHACTPHHPRLLCTSLCGGAPRDPGHGAWGTGWESCDDCWVIITAWTRLITSLQLFPCQRQRGLVPGRVIAW